MLEILFLAALLGQVSDDFNASTLRAPWTFSAPAGGSYSILGAGTADVALQLAVPGGATHDMWTAGAMAPQILQPAPSGDFEVEACFATIPAIENTGQGIVLRESATRFLRFDLTYTGGDLKAFSASVLDGVASIKSSLSVSMPGPKTWIRVARSVDIWTYRYSLDGSSWTIASTFSQAFVPIEIGVFALNAGGSAASAYAAQADYFFNVASPIDPEDAPVAPPPAVVTSVKLAWNPVTMDVDGAPETIAGYQVKASLPDDTTLSTMDVLPEACAGVEVLPMILMAAPSTTCLLRVRARDAAGNWGAWSEPLTAQVPRDVKPPAAPAQLRIEVR